MNEGARRERKVITVVFADLVGFTARSEQLDPEDVEAFLRPYHELLRREFERFGGTVEKFIGDAVAAIFGAPLAHEDDPERAVRAALAVRDAIREAGDLEIRIGIATGEAIVRLDLPPGSGEGYATGDVLNTAARIQAAAPVNGILVAAPTWSATREAITYEAAEAIVAKGKAEPIAVWLAADARSRFGIDVRQGSPVPLVGRERERTLLVDTLERAESERTPQLVTLVGVPGIGKSRLVYELFEELERRSELRTWRQGRSLPYGEGISFWALGEMVKAQAGILEGDEPDTVATKLDAAVGEVVPADEADWVAGWLRPLVGLEVGRELLRDRRDESFTAWRRFFEGLADRRPLVLAFEDIHWADDGLLDFIDHLVDWASGVPILVLCSARLELLERRPGWGGGKRNALTLALSPLSDAEAGRVVDAALGDATLEPAARASLLERASGNPLYAQQFARLLVERGSLPAGGLPESVHGLIAARLDALSREEKAFLQDAAVMGKVFWTGALGVPAAPSLLQNLQRKEFIRRERRASVATEGEFAFCHALVRDVAYSQIPRADRAAKHRRTADWIESLGRPQDHAELIAHHLSVALELGGAAPDADLIVRARAAWRDAGDRSYALNAAPAAVEAYAKAIELTPSDDPERAQLQFRHARAEVWATGGGLDKLAEAAAALAAAGDRETAAEAETLLVRQVWLAGDRDGWTRHMDRAMELVGDTPPSRAKALALAYRARYLFLSGARPEAEPVAREALAIASDLGLDEIRAHALNTLGLARHHGGDTGGLEDLRESIRISEANNSAESFTGWNNLSTLLELSGRMEDAHEATLEALRVARRFGSAADVRWAEYGLDYRLYEVGDWDEAVGRIRQHLAEIEAGSPHYLESSLRYELAQILAARDELDEALDQATRAMAPSRRAGDPQSLFPSLAQMMIVRVARGERQEANEALDELVSVRQRIPAALPFRGSATVVDAIAALGRGDAFLAIAGSAGETKWLAAARRALAGDWAGAVAVYESMRAQGDAALARLRAAQQLAGEQRFDEARAMLEPAMAWFRRAAATRYLREADAVVAASSAQT
jgi:class 3 adenylate cyclase/tetratricopeptide (TPR) repeat protein